MNARAILRLEERVDELEGIVAALKDMLVANLKEGRREPARVKVEGNVIEFPGGAA